MSGVAQVFNYRSYFDIYLELIFPGNWCYSFVFQNIFYTTPYAAFNNTFKEFQWMFCNIWFCTCLITQSYFQSLHLMQSFMYLSLSLSLSLWHIISCGLTCYIALNLWTPLLSIMVFFTLFILFICSGSSETKVFDENSPSGNDYLAEVDKLIILLFIVVHDLISVKFKSITLKSMLR